jgi:uncharacterized protein (TIGR02594 family)
MIDVLHDALPWVIFTGMAALLWRALSALHELAKLLAMQLGQQNAPRQASPAPAAPTAAPVVQPQLPAAAPPKPSGPFGTFPSWFQWALHEIGFHETGNNAGLDRYIGLAHAGANGDPWCAIFANAALESSGVAGTRSASSQSFRNHPGFVQLSGPAPGAIVVFWRGAPDSGLGHVGFYRGEDDSRVWTLGGNENDMVQIEALPKASASFGLIGYWWPKSVSMPAIGPVLMPVGSPVHVQASPSDAPTVRSSAPDAKQTGITATMFGSAAVDASANVSAYGGPIIDSSPGVALPFHFTGPRPKVRVTRAGVSVDCDIVDVGPWNTNDPYWTTGKRPQSETGTDTRGRRTNGAGIDLTFAAAKALQIDGKGLVDWEFLQSPAAASAAQPNVV